MYNAFISRQRDTYMKNIDAGKEIFAGFLKGVDFVLRYTTVNKTTTHYLKERAIDMTETTTKKEKALCNSIIHTASAAAAAVGAGLAQLPGSDNAFLMPIQLTMIISLGKVYGIQMDESSAKAAMASGSAHAVGRAASQALVGHIPVAGNVINAVTAAGLTETIGWIVAKEFEQKSLQSA